MWPVEKHTENSPKTSENNNKYLFFCAFSGTFGQIDIGLLEHNVGVTATHTFDGSHGNGYFAFTINVRIHDTKNVLKLLWNNQRLEKNMLKLARLHSHWMGILFQYAYRTVTRQTHSIRHTPRNKHTQFVRWIKSTKNNTVFNCQNTKTFILNAKTGIDDAIKHNVSLICDRMMGIFPDLFLKLPFLLVSITNSKLQKNWRM